MMNDMDTLLTLYVEEENKNEFRKLCGESGYSFEAGLNMMVQQLLNKPDMAKKLLNQREWTKKESVKEISMEELVAGIQSGTLASEYGDPIMVKNDSEDSYILISAKRYGKMTARLERLEEKLVIHKNSPC